MKTQDDVIRYIDENKQSFIDISNKIWDYAELCFDEHRSASALIEALKKEGFRVRKV